MTEYLPSFLSIVGVVIGAILGFITQQATLRAGDRRDREKHSRERAEVAASILSGVRGRREQPDWLEDQHVSAYELSRSENTNLRRERTFIRDPQVRQAIALYLDLMESSVDQPEDDHQIHDRLIALDQLSEILGAYSRGDAPPSGGLSAIDERSDHA